MRHFIKNNYPILIIFAVFLITRIVRFTDWMWYEWFSEVAWVWELISTWSTFINRFPHFPLAFIFYKIWALLVWNTILWVKAMHLFLNILTFLLIYKTAILFYNDKKVANWSVLIYTISFYAYAWNTMWIDQDLALNPLLFILSLYLYKKLDLSKFKNIILLWLSCALLSSSRLILWVIVMWVIFVDILINKIIWSQKIIKWFIESIRSFIKIFIPYALITSIFIYLMYKIFPNAVIEELTVYKNIFLWNVLWKTWNGPLLLNGVSFLWQVFLYVSPLIFWIFPLIKNFRKHQLLLLSSIIMVMYMLVWIFSRWDPARWMMPIVPIFTILRWFVCSKYINKRSWYFVIIITIVLCVLNYLCLDYSSLPGNVGDYLSSPLNRIFILTTTVFAPVYLNSKIVFWIAWMTVILVLLAFFWKSKISKYMFIFFALWVNLFLVVTNFFQIKQPHMTDIVIEMSQFCFDGCNIDDVIYSDSISKDVAAIWLWDKYMWNYFSLNLDENILDINNKLHKNPFLLSWINLFSQNYQASDYIDTIKTNWPWFVFLTHYFGNSEEINVLNEKCEKVEVFSWNIDEIYWIVFWCNLY